VCVFRVERPETLDLYFLQRFDLHHDYEVNRKTNKCNVSDETGTMPAVWGWLSMATFHGKVKIDGKDYDSWRYVAGGVTLGIAVDVNNSNDPAYFERITSTEHFYLRFQFFRPAKPHASWFDVPTVCTK